MTKPHFEQEYESGAQAIVDWVAGGNFNGYILKKTLIFKEYSNDVVIRNCILHQDRYDGEESDTKIMGKYEFTDKDTITVKYNDFEMRGKILNNKVEYIVFSVYHPLLKTDTTEVYQLK